MTDRELLLLGCEQNPGDRNRLLVAADFVAEEGDLKWERCLRWMAEYDRHPERNDRSGYNVHGIKHPPTYLWTCYGGLCGPKFNCGTNHCLPRTLCRRLGFWEWRLYQTWTEAVSGLADGLDQGWVECVGDPLQVDEQSIRSIEEQNEVGLSWGGQWGGQ